MIDLEKVSGLPLIVKQDYNLKFGEGIPEVKPSVRMIEDMYTVLMEPESLPDRKDMYLMYRKVSRADDVAFMDRHKVRYDITVIPPSMIGQEFNKTTGHYHALKSGTHFAYPEIYQVLYGTGLFLIQKMDAQFKQLISVYALEAKVGDKIIYPPNYGHCIVNTSKDVLVVANWVADHFESDYKDIALKHGMAYYVIADEEKQYSLIPNSNYQDHPVVRVLDPKNFQSFDIMRSTKPMYLAGIENPKSLEFLTEPQKYAVELSSITS
jgi:glucose-6-phosphate isomerase